MDFKALSSFIAVAEEGQLGRAATRLHLSQTPLSRHIQALESDLGVKLFIRTSSGMELTQAGQVLLEDAKNIDQVVRNAKERAKDAGVGKFGQIHVGIYGSSIFGATSSILNCFRKNNPGILMHLNYVSPAQQIQALRRGQVEILFERVMPEENDLVMKHICQERLYVALNATHALASMKTIPIAKLREELFIMGTQSSAVLNVVEICKTAGFLPRLTPPSPNIVTATMLAATGMGVSLVPESMTHVNFPNIVYRPLREKSNFMNLYCFYLKRDSSPVLSLMLESIDEVFGKKMA
jgi:LysR family transcriptional regulator, benzoate and cis,cis-muconate-responsive activator of ben and cat genes